MYGLGTENSCPARKALKSYKASPERQSLHPIGRSWPSLNAAIVLRSNLAALEWEQWNPTLFLLFKNLLGRSHRPLN
jgi:hypothetical protein